MLEAFQSYVMNFFIIHHQIDNGDCFTNLFWRFVCQKSFNPSMKETSRHPQHKLHISRVQQF